MVLEDKTVQDLNKSIKDLIRILNTSGGLKPTDRPMSNKDDGGDAYLTKKQKKQRELEESQIKFEKFKAKALDEMLKKEESYAKLSKQILDNEKKLLEKEQIGNKLNAKKENHIKKLKEYEDLMLVNTTHMTKIEKTNHEKKVKNSKKEYNEAKREYNLQLKQIKAEAKQNKERTKFAEERKSDIDDEAKTLEEVEKKKEKQRKREQYNEKIKNKLKDKGKALFESGTASIVGFMKQTLNSAFEQDSIMSKLAANYTLSRSETASLKQNLLQASISTAFIGVKTEDLVKMQSNYTDELGRSVMLNEDGLVAVANMGIATGIGAEGAAQMAAQMEKFGFSAVSATENIQDLMLASKKTGMSASVMTKKMQENMGIASSYTFKNGVKGFESMVMHSTKLRINMSDVASLADKVSSPEGAIQTAASLQVLGGAFAQMSDPMQLMNQGITDLEGLTNTYEKMLAGVSSINKETGEVTINGYDRLRIKAAAEAMGVSFDGMMDAARTKGKRDAIDAQVNITPVIKGANEETKDMLASLAQFDKKTKQFRVTVGGKSKTLMELSPDDIAQLQPADQGSNLRSIAETTLGLSDIIKNGFNAIVQSLMPKLIELIGDFTEWLMPKMRDLMNLVGTPEGQKKVGKTVGALGGAAFGAQIGSLIGPIGTVAGAAIGGLGGFLAGNAVFGNDVIIPSNGGKPIFLNKKDDVFAMKPNGAVAQAVSNNSTTNILGAKSGVPTYHDGKETLVEKILGKERTSVSSSSDASKIFGGVTPSYSGIYGGNSLKSGSMDLNINGTITLVGGGNSTKISASELVKDRQFVRELTRIIGNQMNRDKNGGKYSGGLNNNSF